MKSRIFYALTFLALTPSVYSQVGIGTKTPDKSAQLEVKADNKGVLIPRVILGSTTKQLDGTNANAESLLVFNSTPFTEGNKSYEKGYYYWDGVKWVKLISGGDLSTTTNTSTGTASVVLEGEVTGAFGDTKVAKLMGKALGTAAPTAQQVLTFDGANWVASGIDLTSLDKTSATNGQVLTIKNGKVVWQDPSTVGGANLTVSGGLEFESGNGTSALLAAAGIRIADNGVTESKIKNDAVTELKIKNDAVTESKIKNDAVTELKIKDGSVTKSKIKDGSVTVEKLSVSGTPTAAAGSVLSLSSSKGLQWTAPQAVSTATLSNKKDLTIGNGFDNPRTVTGALLEAANLALKAGNGITVDAEGVSLGGILTKDAEITTDTNKALVVKGNSGNANVKFENLPDVGTNANQFEAVAVNKTTGELAKKALISGKVYTLNTAIETGDTWNIAGVNRPIYEVVTEVTFTGNSAEAPIPNFSISGKTVVGIELRRATTGNVEIYNTVQIDNANKLSVGIGNSYYVLSGKFYATIRYY